ncbi:hypothetical protein Dimus_033142, partial [Dionaea muscipula]
KAREEEIEEEKEKEEEFEAAHQGDLNVEEVNNVVEEYLKDDTHGEVSRGEDQEKKKVDDVVDRTVHANEDMEEDNPQNDISSRVSRDVNEVVVNPKSNFVDEVLKEVMASIGVDDNPKEGQGWEMMVFQDPVAVESSHLTPLIHENFEQAVKCILK